MDFGHGYEITIEIFEFIYEEPFSHHWDRYQKDSMNFLLTIGSILIPILSLMIIGHAIMRFAHFIAMKNSKSNRCSKIGVKLHPKLLILPLAFLTLFLEGALDLIKGIFLHIKMLMIHEGQV
jgi:hypothetical protein